MIMIVFETCRTILLNVYIDANYKFEQNKSVFLIKCDLYLIS